MAEDQMTAAEATRYLREQVEGVERAVVGLEGAIARSRELGVPVDAAERLLSQLAPLLRAARSRVEAS
jgi:hypothetical protein